MIKEEGKKKVIIIALVIIALALISLVPLLKNQFFKESITGNVIAEENANSPLSNITNYSYLFLLILVPIAVVGMLSYAYVAKKEEIDSSFDIVLHTEEKQNQETLGISLQEYLQDMNPPSKPTQMHEYDVDVLQTHIKNRLLRGYSSEEVYYELVKHGWKREKITAALGNMSITQTEAELILGSFFAKSLSQGHDLQSIKESLLAKGWQPKVIESSSKRFEQSVGSQ